MIENYIWLKKLKIHHFLWSKGWPIFLVLTVFMLVAAHPPQKKTTQATCQECHDQVTLSSTPHAQLEYCTACHLKAETHLEEGGGPNIFAFKEKELSGQKSKVCLSCHAQDLSRYQASAHNKASLDCTTCHSIHQARTQHLLQTKEVKTCAPCHTEILSLFQLNERHRLYEGVISCSDCHDPHQPSQKAALGGFKNQSCLKCHQDKGGPFLYEHGASRIEGCTACHEVHGTPNQHLLTHQSVADLCFSCHGEAPAWHSRFNSYSTNCTVCHATIHGSNLSKIFLK